MTLSGPVPGDVYAVCVLLVAKRGVPTDDQKRLLRSYCGVERVGDYEKYRELAAKVVIHAATCGREERW